MPEIYTWATTDKTYPLLAWVILQINQSEEICEKQLSVFCSTGSQINPLMQVAIARFEHKCVIIVYPSVIRCVVGAQKNRITDGRFFGLVPTTYAK